MKFGAMNFPVTSTLDELKKVSDLKFDYFELSMDPPCAHYSTILGIKTEILQALKKYSLERACHLPTFVYTADLSPDIRSASLKEMLNCLDAAAEIGAEKAVLHPSFTSGLGPLVIDTAKSYAHESLSAISRKADRLDIELCFENMYPRYHTFFNPDHFETVFNEFPRLKMTLDTGHANIGDPDKNRLFQFIQRFPEKIGHVHISDNNGRSDEHLKVGKGNINFKKFITLLKQTGYNDTITFEIFSQDTKDLVASREKITKLIKGS